MAIKSVVFYSSTFPSKADLRSGAGISPNFAFSSGTLPSANSVIQSATLVINGINVYVDSYLNFGNYGTAELSAQSGDQSASCVLTNVNSEAMRSFLISGGGTWNGTITPKRSYSGNVCNFRSTYGSLTVYFNVPDASTFSLNKLSTDIGDTITATVNKADQSYIHDLIWSSPSGAKTTVSLNSGTTGTFTIPNAWEAGSATCTLSTKKSDGSLVGTCTISFTVTVNTKNIMPDAGTFSVTIKQSTYVPWSNIYVKGLSRAKLKLTGYGAGENASIKTIAFACGAQSYNSKDTSTWNTGALNETGDVVCTASVTNSYGNTDSKNATITVVDYYDPQVTSIQAYRCTNDGIPSDTGSNILVKTIIDFASVDFNNSLDYIKAYYKKTTDSGWTLLSTKINSGVEKIIPVNNLDNNSIYQVKICTRDQIQKKRNKESTKTVSVMGADYTLYFKDGGTNISVGMRGTRDHALEISDDWDVYYGDNIVDLSTKEIDNTPSHGSPNAVQSGGTYDMISNSLPTLLDITIPLSGWALDNNNRYRYDETVNGIDSSMAVVASPKTWVFAKRIVSGIRIYPRANYIRFVTESLPTGDVGLVITVQKANGLSGLSFFVREKGGVSLQDVDKLEIVSGVFSGITDMPNMLLLSGNTVYAIFEASFNAKTLANNDNIHALTVPNDYLPFVAQSFNGRRWDATQTENTLPITISTDGAVKMQNNTGSAITFNRMRFFESWLRKTARMVTQFYNNGTGPSNITFNVNEIDADTVNNTVTYKLDARWPSFSSFPMSFISLPKGFGPARHMLQLQATMYFSDGTTMVSDNSYYPYIGRDGTEMSFSFQPSNRGLTGVAFEVTTELYQEYVAFMSERQSWSNTWHPTYTTNRMTIDPSTGKIRFQLDCTFPEKQIYTYGYGTELGIYSFDYPFEPKNMPSNTFDAVALDTNGNRMAVKCSLRGGNGCRCAVYVQRATDDTPMNINITGLIFDCNDFIAAGY